MKYSQGILGALLGLTVLSSSIIGWGSIQKDSSFQNLLSSNNLQTQQTLTRQKQADTIISKVINGINKGDATVISPYLIRQDQSLDAAKAAIQDYRIYFKGEKINRFQRIGQAPNRPDTLLYKLYNSKGVSKEIFVSFQNQQPQVYDEFLNYSYGAKKLLGNFLQNIQQKNAQNLARLLSPDDIDYPVGSARKVIFNYEKKFDTRTLKYRFEGLEAKSNSFIYTLYGSKQGKPVQHRVQVIHGDGLVGLRDNLIPENVAIN